MYILIVYADVFNDSITKTLINLAKGPQNSSTDNCKVSPSVLEKSKGLGL